nr:ABC transporter ATP-binding protein [Anaerolineales bacterium]
MLNPLEHRYHGEHPLRTLWYMLEAERGALLLAAALFIVKHSPVWLMPLLTANILDVLVQRRPLGELWLNALILLGLLFQNIPLNTLYVRYLSRAVRAVELRLRSALCRRLQHLSIGYFTRRSAGVLQSKVMRDVEAVEQMLRQAFDGGAAALSNILGALVITAVRAPAFVGFFLVLVPVAAWVVLTLRHTLGQRNRQFRAEVEQLAARVTEMTHLIPITRAHGLEDEALARLDQTL